MKNYNNSIIITQKEAKKYISIREIIDIEVQTYKWYSEGKIVMPAKITLSMDKLGLPNWINSMPSYIKPLDILGIKWAGGFKGNKEDGLPYIMAQILINDPHTGILKSLVDGNWITDIRTGAQSAVAAKYLANKTEVIAIIGAGIQGINTAFCMLEEFNVKKINVYDIDREVCKNFVKEINQISSVSVNICNSNKEAVVGSDVITTATTANKILVEEEWVKPGALVSTIGSYQELSPDLIFAADKLFVDHLEQNIHRGEYSKYFNSNELEENDIQGEIGDVISGKIKGRENEDERIIISPIGMGCLDIAIAADIYKKIINDSDKNLIEFNMLN